MATALVQRPAHVPADRQVDFDIYQPFRDGKDFHMSWKALQQSNLPDVVWTPYNGGHWMVLRGRLITHVLSDYERFSNHTVLVPKETAGAAYRLIPLSLDPPVHGPFRALLNAGLSPIAVKRVEGTIRHIASSLIESFRAAGRCNFTKDFAEQLPVRVFMRIVDLPMEDAPRLKHLADQFTRPDGSLTYDQVNQRFRDYLVPIIHRRRGGDGVDMISRMVNGMIGDRPLTDEEAIILCEQVLVGGLDTVVNFTGFVMLYLAGAAEARRQLVADPALIRKAVDELLRRFPLVTVGREVRRDITWEGVDLKEGEMVVAPTVLHGLDDAENAKPLEIDFKRGVIRHATFGYGSHTCPGSHLARTETRIILEEWLKRIPDFGLPEGFEATYTGGIVASVVSVPLVWDPSKTHSVEPYVEETLS